MDEINNIELIKTIIPLINKCRINNNTGYLWVELTLMLNSDVEPIWELFKNDIELLRGEYSNKFQIKGTLKDKEISKYIYNQLQKDRTIIMDERDYKAMNEEFKKEQPIQPMIVYTITEEDFNLGTFAVIGVCDSIEKANEKINRYYGQFKELEHEEIRDSGLEFKKKLRVNGAFGLYDVYVSVESFILND